jgi:predicted O-linked N-acetylglucosamine transferase (SPINDLY family)
VQVSAWGYMPGPGTPGIDYLLTDRVIVPAAEEPWFSERVVPLPCAQPYNGDLSQRPEPTRSPGLPVRPVRFGCFNRYDKLSPGALSLWAQILAACPGATLTFKDRFFAEAAPRDRIRAALAREGVDPERAVFELREAHADYLAAHDRIDVALDPFPVNGGATTLAALSQGVPVVALHGGEPSSRIGASILAALGLHECSCATPADYLRTAVRLARDPAALAELKRAVRQAARSSFKPEALQSYAATVEEAYREMWERQCRAGSPG